MEDAMERIKPIRAGRAIDTETVEWRKAQRVFAAKKALKPEPQRELTPLERRVLARFGLPVA